jgi:hypothetical protein
MSDSCLGTLGETHDGFILVEPLQTKILQAQDVIDLHCVHENLLSVVS